MKLKAYVWTNAVLGSLVVLGHSVDEARAIVRADGSAMLAEYVEAAPQFSDAAKGRLALAAWDIRDAPDEITTPTVLCAEDRGEIARAWTWQRENRE